MNGLPLIDPETATGETAELLALAQSACGLTPNLSRAMANNPAVLRGYLDFGLALRERGCLPDAVRRRVDLFVAQHHSCEYVLSAHTYVGTKVSGLSEEEAERARRGESGDPQAAAALALTAALLKGGEPEPGMGIEPAHVVEIVAEVALATLLVHLADAGQVPVDWPLVRPDD
ncbi:carboxymuconolactone decarboxylase family protein [Streptomyces sp. NBC_01304]|uniref:carboxymuconolactone decarboxylase family protein n=1 Tax=Streptomyces sp. NBC_01304 TaxID=2903818 RepID=UPI002E12E9FF|nr:carboxymuconolactone decarboxylase family protein [Streptomyces sp. NBC_01304]